MRARTLAAFGATLLFVLACSSGDEAPADKPVEEPKAEEPAADDPLAKGMIHVEFPAMAADFEVGQFVLAPGEDTLKKLVAGESQSVIFYAATVLEVGEHSSKVKSEAGTESTIPNIVIVPIKAGGKAKAGDLLFGHWESGSGMKRAVATEGGSPEAPKVRYLDFDFDSNLDKEDQFEADRFQKIKKPFDLGTSVACGEGDDGRDHGILVRTSGDRLLVSGFAGKLSAHDTSECVSLVPSAEYAKGDKVFIPKVGRYTAGTVEKVDLTVGRVWVKYTWGGTESTEAVAILDVTKDFTQQEGGGGAEGGEGGGGREGKAREGGGGGGGGKGDHGKGGKAKGGKAKNH